MPSISNTPREYTEADKAQWILENGHPKFVWIFERVDEQVYRKPMAEPGTELPPWMPTEREPCTGFSREPLNTKGLVDTIKKGNTYD